MPGGEEDEPPRFGIRREIGEFAERWRVALNRTLKFVAEEGFTYEYTDNTTIPPGPMDDVQANVWSRFLVLAKAAAVCTIACSLRAW